MADVYDLPKFSCDWPISIAEKDWSYDWLQGRLCPEDTVKTTLLPLSLSHFWRLGINKAVLNHCTNQRLKSETHQLCEVKHGRKWSCCEGLRASKIRQLILHHQMLQTTAPIETLPDIQHQRLITQSEQNNTKCRTTILFGEKIHTQMEIYELHEVINPRRNKKPPSRKYFGSW